jgi:hypothetical protein
MGSKGVVGYRLPHLEIFVTGGAAVAVGRQGFGLSGLGYWHSRDLSANATRSLVGPADPLARWGS